jgi:hypothetical protein
MLAACSSHGVGFCLGAENAIDLNQQIVDKATIRIDFVSPDEMAVRGAGSRPYRARLRPALSA